MFCPKCGQWNAGSATQCTACGTSLLPAGLGTTPPPAAPTPTGPAPVPQPPLPYPNPTYTGAPGNTPPAYPSYSPLPNYTPMATGAPYGGAPAYGTGYPAQMSRTANQCKVCGSLIAYGTLSCAICLVPMGMIANPFDPTVTTYLDARALNQPGTSPVYAAPGAYAARAPGSTNSVPEEARKGWNWSAALNSTLWAFTHRSAAWGLYCAAGVFLWVVVILGLSTVPKADAGDAVIGTLAIGAVAGVFWIIKTLYLGFKGNELAWRSGRFTNVSQMKNVQRQWVPWSIAVFLVASGVLTAATIIAGKH